MKPLTNLIPDFAAMRGELNTKLKFPVPIVLDDDRLGTLTESTKSLCGKLNSIAVLYRKHLPLGESFESFSEKVLPLVLRQLDEKVFTREMKTRWIKKNNLKLQLSGGDGEIELKDDAQMEFLLSSVAFPKEFEDDIRRLHHHIRSCKLPEHVGYIDLFDAERGGFVVSKLAEEKLMEACTHFARDIRDLERLFMAGALCEALNIMKQHHIPVGIPAPPFVQKILAIDPDPSADPGFVRFKVPLQRLLENRVVVTDLKAI